MIAWIDITSPGLRSIFNEWCGFRKNKLIPSVDDCNDFSLNVPQQNLISVVVPKARGEAFFRYVGDLGHQIAPKAHPKQKLGNLTPVPERVVTTTPFYQSIRSSQPYCRRGEYVSGTNKRPYEQLVLPFADANGRVCLVDAVFVDIGD